jgi:hypothetical protein
MKKLCVILLSLLSACATLHTNHDPSEQDRTVVSFVDAHNQGNTKAFAAASTWASRNFPGGKDAVLSSDQVSGTIVMKGAYKWVKATDPFQTHFQEGWVPYTLTVKVSDSSIGMDFLTGDAYGDIDASPTNIRKELSPFYQKLRDSLVIEIGGTKSGS